MYEYLLPIGSVVRLKNAAKDLMIFGLLQKHPNLGERVFDYIGVPHPEGYFDVRLQIGFNHSQIDQVVFRGLENDNQKALMNSLEVIGAIQKKRNEQ
ncbi:MAG: DUF4176 domain-containing protein [Erysipelotrichaceae bacterium]